MDVGGLIAKLLINSAVSAHNQKKAEEAMPLIRETVEKYYMTFFGEIFLLDEREWILDNKIRPMVAKMNGKELAGVLKIMDKNNKLVKKKKPINVLVSKETVKAYHLEYHNEKKADELEKRRAAERREEEIRARRKVEAEKERIANRERVERLRRWQEYIIQFKKYNKAQKRAEFEWFKKKTVNTFATNQEQRDACIHKLEMIMLEDED